MTEANPPSRPGPVTSYTLCPDCRFNLKFAEEEGVCPRCAGRKKNPGDGTSDAWVAMAFGIVSLPGIFVWGVGGMAFGWLGVWLATRARRRLSSAWKRETTAYHVATVGLWAGMVGAVLGTMATILLLIFVGGMILGA